MPVVVSIDALDYAYDAGPFALHVSSLQLHGGQSTVFSGPSGCGKTTLLNLIAGILPAASGGIVVAGTELHRLSDRERRLFRLQTVGQVFQDFQLIDYLNVLENVLLPCRIHPSVRLTPALRDRGRSLLSSVGLGDCGRRSIAHLSQGERQRVAICRALLLSPQIVLADEPTGNLDPASSQTITQLLLSEATSSDATLIMVTHDHSLLPMFDRSVDFGQFLRAGSAARSPGVGK